MNKSIIQTRVKNLLENVDDPKEFKKNLQNLLKLYIDKEGTKNYQRIIPNTGKFYGVTKPILKIIAAEIGKFYYINPDEAYRLLNIIWDEGSYEAKQIAGKSIEKFAPKHPKICLNFISKILDEIDNWSVCDNLAMFGIEPIVLSNPDLVLPLSEEWINSENKWIRRFGVVTLRGYKRVKTTNQVFKILDTIMVDNEKDVKKAVSWILREITKGNPDEVTVFLKKWAQRNPSKHTRWIIKDGMKKLPEKEREKISAILS